MVPIFELEIHFHSVEDYHNKDIRKAIEVIEEIFNHFQYSSFKKIKMEMLEKFELLKRKISISYDIKTDVWEFHLTGLDGLIKSFTIQKKTRNLEVDAL